MTKQEHIEHHKGLHEFLDELLADYVSESGRLITGTTLHEFLKWSSDQTKNPSDKFNQYPDQP